MSEQTLDLRRSLRIVRRHLLGVSVAAAIGLSAGVGFTVIKPELFSSAALVVLPPSTHDIATEALVARSDAVLAGVLSSVDLDISLQTLRSRVTVLSPTSSVLSITAEGKSAALAEETANAVAESYIAYVGTSNSAAGSVQARLLEPAASATRTSFVVRLILIAVVGALLGALLGIVAALALSRGDRRLRLRDEFADAVGAPVLASLPVRRLSSAAGWSKLLDGYRPGVADAWRLRNALQYLGLTDATSVGSARSLAVISLASDRRALAVGPQLSAYAASQGIPTVLVIGPQQDSAATATLRTACAAAQPRPRRSSQLRVAVADQDHLNQHPDGMLSVVVVVVDAGAPQMSDAMRTGATVLAVSPGIASAEQLARAAAAIGRQIDGIFVADPESADPTTGRIPQLVRPARQAQPTRVTDLPSETKR